jgi:N-glycosylase/DNA lyase
MVQNTASGSELRQSTSGLPPTAPGFAWNTEDCADQPFNLSATLASGQNFRWRRDAQGVWWGTVESTVMAAWQANGQPDSPLYWQTFPRRDQRLLVRDYFRLDVALFDLYTAWIRAEPRMTEAVSAFRGLRVLRQPPQECLFAFQCAACNTVVKIERSVTHLAAHYGQPIELEIEIETGLPALLTSSGTTSASAFYTFPALNALADADESVLRAGLWGYRAPRVIALARHLRTLPADWLISLRQQPYADAHAALTNLFGIGAKLADCICLFALDKDAAVPVDTHIRQIAVRLFAPDLAGKSLTPRLYNALADTYRSRFGDWAGWAQQYLFFAELHRAQDYKCD